MSKRAAIIGTAESWVEAPFKDPNITICTLNDGYSIPPHSGRPGFAEIGRSDEHYDLHPFKEMWFRPKGKHVFKPSDIPEGAYVRPEGHLDWLRAYAEKRFVWLNDTPPEGWPAKAKRFPWEKVLEFLSARPDQTGYLASSPAAMLAHLAMRGFTTVEIYGIHLATAHEYREQRPNMEWLMGKLEGMGIKIVIPESCPLLKHSHRYAMEPRPVPRDRDAQRRIKQAQQQYSQLVEKMASMPRWKNRDAEQERLLRIRAELRDAHVEARRAVLS